jgi:hypothetical protein
MDMRQLFDDFKRHVESLDDEAIRQSIAKAVEHSSNSLSLECTAEKKNGVYVKSSTQDLQYSNFAYGFTFSSVNVSGSTSSYAISNLGGVAA